MALLSRTLRSEDEPSTSRPRCQRLRRRLGLRASLLALCLLAATSVIGIFGAPPASATPATPPTDGSWYMNTTSTSTACNLGCNHGKYDASTGHSSEDVLDFGG
jgi:hypothetical protein